MTATFSPRRLAAFRALWRAVIQGRRPGAPGLGDRLRALPRMLGGAASGRYPELTRGRLALLVLAVAYLVSPVDVVPEAFLALLGLADDAVVALWLGGAFLVETQRFLDWERTRPVIVEQAPPA
ncbi:YkvA family protein [Pseudonocardia sp. H11422]|uniref:YkvA family protein n=1 Tax=Pseudonocardia sp. H11422 TaxID=2835866 RepID=UPI001BDC3EF4|nr:YkvA family protein [Pseudonocardia sp. H11422]